MFNKNKPRYFLLTIHFVGKSNQEITMTIIHKQKEGKFIRLKDIKEFFALTLGAEDIVILFLKEISEQDYLDYKEGM